MYCFICRFELCESDRRVETNSTYQTLNELIGTVHAECQQLNDDLCSEWSALSVASSNESPDELSVKLGDQLIRAGDVLNRKQAIIQQLQQHIDSINEQYVNSIAAQSIDINSAIGIVDNGYDDIMKQIVSELDQCESTYNQDRNQLINNHNSQLSVLYDKRRSLELLIHTSVQKCEQQYSDSLDVIRQNDCNDYSELKQELESNIELFQIQLESMKSIYALNSDKLLYNYTILQQKDVDNKQLLDTTRAKLRKLKDMLNLYTQKYQLLYNTFKQENVTLSTDYTRLINTYKHLQNKFIYFQSNSNIRYNDVWQHSAQENLQLIKKLFQADQIVTTKILNNQYTVPVPDMLNTDSEAYNIDDITIDSLTTNINTIQQLTLNDNNNSESIKSDQHSARTRTANKSCTADQQRHVIDTLIDHASYLLPASTTQLQSVNPNNEQSKLLAADEVLSCIGVHDVDDYNTLMSMFINDSGELCPLSHTTVSSIVQEFLRSNTSAHSQTSTHLQNTRANNEKQQKQNKRIQQFWTDLRDVIETKTNELWPVLEERLIKYNNVCTI